MVAVDDSSSMADNHSKQLAFESLATIVNAMTLLEVGQVAIARWVKVICGSCIIVYGTIASDSCKFYCLCRTGFPFSCQTVFVLEATFRRFVLLSNLYTAAELCILLSYEILQDCLRQNDAYVVNIALLSASRGQVAWKCLSLVLRTSFWISFVRMLLWG